MLWAILLESFQGIILNNGAVVLGARPKETICLVFIKHFLR